MSINVAHFKLEIEGDIDMALIDNIVSAAQFLNSGLANLVSKVQGVEDGVDALGVKIQALIDAGGASPAQLQSVLDELNAAGESLSQGTIVAQEALDKEAILLA